MQTDDWFDVGCRRFDHGGAVDRRISAQAVELQERRATSKGLRIETATLTERVAHVDDLREVLKGLQERDGTGASKGRSKPAE